MAIHKGSPEQPPEETFQERIRRLTLERIRKEGLSVREALKQNLNPFVVAEVAKTEQEYFDVACAALDPVGTEGIHPRVRKKELSFKTAHPNIAYLTADIAHGLVESKLEEIHWTTEEKGQRLFELRKRFAEIVKRNSPVEQNNNLTS